jgi:hypothetical protein
MVIYHHILTLEKEGTTLNHHGIFITEASGFILLAEVCPCLYFLYFSFCHGYCVTAIFMQSKRCCSLMDHLHWRCYFGKNIGNRDNVCSCLGYLGRCNKNRNNPICVAQPKVAKARTMMSVACLLPVAVAGVIAINSAM